MLDVDKNKKLNIPDLYPNIIRTGTVGEGSCFIHAVLKGLNLDNYSKMNKEDKMIYVEALRKKMSEEITLEYYKVNLSSISMLSLSQELSKFLKIVYHFINHTEEYISDQFIIEMVNENITVFKMITTLLSEKEFIGVIDNPFITSSHHIDEYIKNYNSSFYRLFLKKLEEEDVKLSEERLDICKSKIKKFIESTCNFIVETNFKKYKKELKNKGIWCSDLLFGFILDYLNIDAYFIDISKREKYIDHTIKKNRPAVVIGWIDENHFENIGIMEEDQTITRLFQPDHPFINKLKN
jgi:hypothetical protein